VRGLFPAAKARATPAAFSRRASTASRWPRPSWSLGGARLRSRERRQRDEIRRPRKLHQKKYRESSGAYLVEGEHLVLELQKAAKTRPPPRRLRALRHIEFAPTWRSPFTTHVINARQMAQISRRRARRRASSRWYRCRRPPCPSGASAPSYLHEIQDPGNLGTILRTLAWFGGFRCLLTPGSVDPYNSKVMRASMGAIFHVPVEIGRAARVAGRAFPRIACLDVRGTPLQSPGFATVRLLSVRQ
jgi:TrmH family RNA methyltransferase